MNKYVTMLKNRNQAVFSRYGHGDLRTLPAGRGSGTTRHHLWKSARFRGSKLFLFKSSPLEQFPRLRSARVALWASRW